MKNFNFFTLILLLGFFNVNAQWEQTNGPYGSEICAFGIIDNDIFAGNRGDFVYRSINDGDSWTKTNMPCSFSMAVANGKIYTVKDNIVFVSDDKGESYSSINIGLDDDCNAYSVNILGTNILVDTENEGKVISTDDGETWSNVTFPGGFIGAVCYADTCTLAATSGGIFASYNEGLTWELWALEEEYISDLERIGSTIFATTLGSGLYVTENNGEKWYVDSTTITDRHILDIELHSSALVVSTNSDGLFVSTDNGESFDSFNVGLAEGTKIVNIFINENTVFASSSYKGIYKIDLQNRTWKNSSSGIEDFLSVRTLLTSGDRVFAGTGLGGLYYSDDNGVNWLQGDLPFGIYEMVESSNTIYVATSHGIYKSENNGNSFGFLGLNDYWTKSIAVIGNDIYVGTGHNGIFKSSNNGNSWSDINTGLPDGSNVYCIANKGTDIYIGTYDDGIYKSTDNGQNWVHSSSGITYNFVESLFVDGDAIYAGVWWKGVYKSTDNGATWNYMALNEKCVTQYAKRDNKLYAATWEHGMYYSTDEGTTWLEMNNGFDKPSIEAFTFDDKNLYTGNSFEQGVWKYALTTTGVPNNMNKVKMEIYPNPAIDYISVQNLSSTEFVSIYNTKGQLVLSKILKGSENRISVKGLPQGVYFLKVGETFSEYFIKG